MYFGESVISVNKMMKAIKINASVLYDLSYVVNFDTQHLLFYINMPIKNNDSVIYDLSYVMNFDRYHLFYVNIWHKYAVYFDD